MSKKMPFKLRLQRIILYSVAVLVVTAAVLLSIARLLVSDVSSYRLDMERLASAFLDYPVKIDSMDARFVGLSPTLVFKNVRMLDVKGERELISFREARLNLAVLASLQAEKLVPGDLLISMLFASGMARSAFRVSTSKNSLAMKSIIHPTLQTSCPTGYFTGHVWRYITAPSSGTILNRVPLAVSITSICSLPIRKPIIF
jgi:hypothetical protein